MTAPEIAPHPRKGSGDFTWPPAATYRWPLTIAQGCNARCKAFMYLARSAALHFRQAPTVRLDPNVSIRVRRRRVESTVPYVHSRRCHPSLLLAWSIGTLGALSNGMLNTASWVPVEPPLPLYDR